ncbi:unnamed protein product [Adineta ricciae]|uniref:RING-CH-type domain-containing protein n=1 Tax=Adineta ricciae TaxID=249248 RepID=A0A813ZT35_ADIRI|nr:unnamed protein product [Adineta ricciae]CAF0902227.1 unnamed protein product [Adineta ricciae]
MILKIFSLNHYPAHENTKTRSELISLITEPFTLQPAEECSSSVTVNHEQGDKQETENIQICRICYSTSDLQSLIAPCQCTGTMGILHQNCLERWLEISNTTKCEICQHEYDVVRHPKSLFYFFANPIRSSDVRYSINDLIIFCILTIIISWLSVLTVSKIQRANTFYDKISYIPLLLSIISIYIVWCWVSYRYHFQVIKEWRSLNQQIRLVNRKKYKVDLYPPHGDQQQCSLLPTIQCDNGDNPLSEVCVLK